MKNSKLNNSANQPREETPLDLVPSMDLIAEQPYKASFQASREIQDQILTRVAKKAWENELVTKFQVPYVKKEAVMSASYLVGHKPDAKEDDAVFEQERIDNLPEEEDAEAQIVTSKLDIHCQEKVRVRPAQAYETMRKKKKQVQANRDWRTKYRRDSVARVSLSSPSPIRKLSTAKADFKKSLAISPLGISAINKKGAEPEVINLGAPKATPLHRRRLAKDAGTSSSSSELDSESQISKGSKASKTKKPKADNKVIRFSNEVRGENASNRKQ